MDESISDKHSCIEFAIKDTVKAFHDFRKKQQKCMK